MLLHGTVSCADVLHKQWANPKSYDDHSPGRQGTLLQQLPGPTAVGRLAVKEVGRGQGCGSASSVPVPGLILIGANCCVRTLHARMKGDTAVITSVVLKYVFRLYLVSRQTDEKTNGQTELNWNIRVKIIQNQATLRRLL